MIEARGSAPNGFVSRLAARAAKLAEAAAANRRRAIARDPWRWRRATLLWPLFTKD